MKANDNNEDIELSLNWVYDHIDDADINEPLKEDDENSKGFDEESLNMMKSMGLSEKLCIKGLKLKDGNVEQAIDWVFSNLDDNGELENESKSTKAEHGNKFLGEENHMFCKVSFVIKVILCTQAIMLRLSERKLIW